MTDERDEEVILTEQELKNLRTGYVTSNRETGWLLLLASRTGQSLHYFHAACAAKPDDIRTLVGRATAREKLKIYQKASEDAHQILTLNEYNKDGILVTAKCELGSRNFEDALQMFHKGINKRGKQQEFVEGEAAIRGIIHKTIGKHAGPALSNLQPHIRKMVKKQKAMQEKKPNRTASNCLEESSEKNICCSAEQYNRTQKNREKQETLMYDIYLDDMAEDYHFFKRLAQQPDLEQLAEHGMKEITEQLIQLREQLPIYYLQNQSFYPFSLKDQRKRRKISHDMSIKEIHRLIGNLKQYKHLHETKKSCYEADKIKGIIETLDDSYDSTKTLYGETVSQLIGQVYLDGLKVCNNLSNQDNRQRINHILGFEPLFRDEWFDPTIKVDNFPFFDSRKWQKKYKEYISLCENNLEKCWLHYEVARCYFIQREWEHLVFEAKKSANCARLCDNLIWRINSLFQVVVGFCRLKNKDDALENLLEALQHAFLLQNQHLIEFLSQVKEVLEGKTDDAFYVNVNEIIKKREKTIIRLQKDFSKKERACDLLSRINLLPVDRRFALVPGFKHIDSKKFTNKSIIRGSSGGRLGLHPITTKNYLQFCGVNQGQIY